MTHDVKLTDKQHKLLRSIMSYALSNIEDINDSLDDDYSEADVKSLAAAVVKEKVATFCIRAIYNPAITNVDELCSALDIVVGQALSTRGIMEEYGNPEFSSFEEMMTSES